MAKLALKLNDGVIGFENVEEVKVYFAEWCGGEEIEYEDKNYDVVSCESGKFVDLMVEEGGKFTLYNECMCERGDDYVEVELFDL